MLFVMSIWGDSRARLTSVASISLLYRCDVLNLFTRSGSLSSAILHIYIYICLVVRFQPLSTELDPSSNPKEYSRKRYRPYL